MATLALFKYGSSHVIFHISELGTLPQPFVAVYGLKISGNEVAGFCGSSMDWYFDLRKEKKTVSSSNFSSYHSLTALGYQICGFPHFKQFSGSLRTLTGCPTI